MQWKHLILLKLCPQFGNKCDDQSQRTGDSELVSLIVAVLRVLQVEWHEVSITQITPNQQSYSLRWWHLAHICWAFIRQIVKKLSSLCTCNDISVQFTPCGFGHSETCPPSKRCSRCRKGSKLSCETRSETKGRKLLKDRLPVSVGVGLAPGRRPEGDEEIYVLCCSRLAEVPLPRTVVPEWNANIWTDHTVNVSPRGSSVNAKSK